MYATFASATAIDVEPSTPAFVAFAGLMELALDNELTFDTYMGDGGSPCPGPDGLGESCEQLALTAMTAKPR